MELTTKIIADKVIKVTKCDIRKTRRTPNVVISRVVYAKLCTKLINVNLTQIGREINKHHATIIHYQSLSNNPNYFKLDRQTQYLNILSELIKEYDLKVLEEPTQNQNLLNQIIDKDNNYTKLLMKYNELNTQLEDAREVNTKLVEKNLKLSLSLK